MKKETKLLFFLLTFCIGAYAQNKTLSLEEAVKYGVQNSKQLKLSQNKIDAALSQVEQIRDKTMPSVKASAGFSNALMLSQSLTLPSANGDPKTIKLPFDNQLYLAGISVNEPIFDNHRFRYAKESANLLLEMSKLDADKDRDEIIYTIISAYINYYKIQQSQKVLAQNLVDIETKLEEIKKFENQGLATRNDVLTFELQQSNIELLVLDLESNYKIANYSMNILLGLPDSTDLQVEEVSYKLDGNSSFNDYLAEALTGRKEFGTIKYEDRLADLNIKKVQDEKLPTLGVSGNFYYINPTKNIIPKSGSYLAPLLVGINIGWDVTSLFQNKNKMAEAKIRKQEVTNTRELISDKIKTEVNQNYRQYQTALNKIKILQTSVVKAMENERITESKFHNNLATTTERIDAQTLLYQSRIQLELAKADATLAYYNLLNASGQIKF
ncbi:MAG: TolC family protein [Sphingobacteriales bacterium]